MKKPCVTCCHFKAYKRGPWGRCLWLVSKVEKPFPEWTREYPVIAPFFVEGRLMAKTEGARCRAWEKRDE